MRPPVGGNRISNISEYRTNIKDLTHVAVWRKTLEYFHHYLVLEVHNSNHANIIHYTAGKYALTALSVVRIKCEILRYDDRKTDLLDFEAGVFFIYREGYPSTPMQKLDARLRAISRKGEAEYSVSINNCESFVTWALTGSSSCEQFEESGTGKRIFVDSLESVLDSGKKIVLSRVDDIRNPLLGTSASHMFTKSADVLAEIAFAQQIAKEAASKSAGSTLTSAVVKTGAATASKAGASAAAAGVSAGISAAVAVPIEAAFCGMEIHNLLKQKENGHISKKAFKRLVTKKVTGSASSVTLSTGGGFLGIFIGQIACPIPVVGGLIGGAVGGILGSVIGRTAGSAVSGKIFDVVTD